MSGTLILFKIIGFVTLLLWGTHLVTSSILTGFGGILRQRIGGALSNPFKAFFSGIAVTLALQSSTATGLMASSFAAHGFLSAVPGFSLMLGANVGTALVTQALSFPAELLIGPLFLFGFILFKKSTSSRWSNMGRAFIGVGLMFLSLHELVATFQPLGEIPLIRQIFISMGNQVFLAMLIGAGAAWLCHSSVAVVLLVMSLVTGGGLPLEAALSMVLGANLGGAIPPVMEVSGPIARRIPLGNLMVRAAGVCGGLFALPYIATHLAGFNLLSPRTVVDAHVAFNLFVAFVAFPFAKPVCAFVNKLLPDPIAADIPGQPKYLDETVVSQSHLALANVEREVHHLSDTVHEQLMFASRALSNFDAVDVRQCGVLGDAATGLGRSIRHYLSLIPTANMSDEETKRTHDLIDFVINIEHAADLMPHNLVEPLVERNKGGDILSVNERQMLNGLMTELDLGLKLSLSVLIRYDMKSARDLIERKGILRDKEMELGLQFQNTSSWPSAKNGAVEVDLMLKSFRECRHIYAHFAAIAYRVLENAGQLRSRVVDGGGS